MNPIRTLSVATLLLASTLAHLAAVEWGELPVRAAAAPAAAILHSGHPRLVLHLLGRFPDPDCCANSRLFKVLVHPDPRVAPLLDALQPLWFSERAVPKVTIDLGDGRVLRTTFTGNSVHYLLDGDGVVVDALPGLVGPGAFRQWLDEATALAALPVAARPARRAELIATAHQEYEAACRLMRVPPASEPAAGRGAAVAAGKAMSKALVERPVFAALGRDLAPIERWRRLGLAVAPALVQLSPSAAAEVARQAGAPEALPPLLERLAADTARARWELRPRALELIADLAAYPATYPAAYPATYPATDRLTTLNHAIYAQVLDSPLDDPWNGFDPRRVWDGIDRSPTGWNPLSPQ